MSDRGAVLIAFVLLGLTSSCHTSEPSTAVLPGAEEALERPAEIGDVGASADLLSDQADFSPLDLLGPDSIESDQEDAPPTPPNVEIHSVRLAYEGLEVVLEAGRNIVPVWELAEVSVGVTLLDVQMEARGDYTLRVVGGGGELAVVEEAVLGTTWYASFLARSGLGEVRIVVRGPRGEELEASQLVVFPEREKLVGGAWFQLPGVSVVPFAHESVVLVDDAGQFGVHSPDSDSVMGRLVLDENGIGEFRSEGAHFRCEQRMVWNHWSPCVYRREGDGEDGLVGSWQRTAFGWSDESDGEWTERLTFEADLTWREEREGFEGGWSRAGSWDSYPGQYGTGGENFRVLIRHLDAGNADHGDSFGGQETAWILGDGSVLLLNPLLWTGSL